MTELEELKERVRILEQRSRRLRNVGIGLALFVIAGLALAQQRQGAAPRTLEAERLIIRYPNGKAAIVLGTASNVIEEQAVADFYTPDGATGTGIYAGSNTSSVRVVSPKGERQIYMQASSDYKVSDLNVGANAT